MKLTDAISEAIVKAHPIRLGRGLALRYEPKAQTLALSRIDAMPSDQEVKTVIEHAGKILPSFDAKKEEPEWVVTKTGVRHGIIRIMFTWHEY